MGERPANGSGPVPYIDRKPHVAIGVGRRHLCRDQLSVDWRNALGGERCNYLILGAACEALLEQRTVPGLDRKRGCAVRWAGQQAMPLLPRHVPFSWAVASRAASSVERFIGRSPRSARAQRLGH